MREIRFRGKRGDNGEWVYGLPVIYCNKTYILVLTDFEEERVYEQYPHKEMWSYEVIPETVGQYTGLKDKNGVEIYEGDIISRENTYENNCVVKWDGESCGFTLNYIYFDESYNMNEFWDDFEVIGNIYEDGHLLKK